MRRYNTTAGPSRLPIAAARSRRVYGSALTDTVRYDRAATLINPQPKQCRDEFNGYGSLSGVRQGNSRNRANVSALRGTSVRGGNWGVPKNPDSCRTVVCIPRGTWGTSFLPRQSRHGCSLLAVFLDVHSRTHCVHRTSGHRLFRSTEMGCQVQRRSPHTTHSLGGKGHRHTFPDSVFYRRTEYCSSGIPGLHRTRSHSTDALRQIGLGVAGSIECPLS